MATLKVDSIGEYIRQQREQAKISLRQLAQAAGVSNPYLSQIERGLRKPSAEILQQIAKGLRISAEALYVQAGFLDESGAGSDVRRAVLADRGINDRQKQVLLEIYESFRKENERTGDVHGGGEAENGRTTTTDSPSAESEAPDVPAEAGPRADASEAGASR
ncbi:helix-turn-helix domain-containing protein [Allonocardiopsis opalescens]|uniref:Helix-turn-helix protein n=1 Tax=Allonocardiopsis opalescens TaxID=1144618 RepID=A0A2T0QAB5_9ACTN|nr:helix-turn-helix transcriptional regulator [Allonocardiopsis opalescens]PRY00752.1 helix-turn-helix protein [Allonocardiopsis opalescens]